MFKVIPAPEDRDIFPVGRNRHGSGFYTELSTRLSGENS